MLILKDPFWDMFDKVLDVPTKTPQTNIRKTDNEYKIYLSVPGLTKKDLNISVKDNVLKISYEKDDAHLFVSSFSKLYTIPDYINEDEIQGKVENGILELTLPIVEKKIKERLISLN